MKRLKYNLIIAIGILLSSTLSSCESLLGDLIDDKEEKIEERMLIGKWKAVEYYSNDFPDPSELINKEDFSGVNQIDQMISYKMESTTCPGKVDSYEEQIQAFDLELSSNKNLSFHVKEHFKNSAYDPNCKLNHVDDSQEVTNAGKWEANLSAMTITLKVPKSAFEEATFYINEISSNKLGLSLDNDGVYHYIILVK